MFEKAVGLMHHLFSRTVFTGCGRWFDGSYLVAAKFCYSLSFREFIKSGIHTNKLTIVKTNLYSPELQKCYFLFNHKQICSKVPILLYFVRPKHPSGNCYVSCFLTEKTPLPSLKEYKY